MTQPPYNLPGPAVSHDALTHVPKPPYAPDSHSWLSLAIATPLLIVSNGRWIVPVAAWLSTIFFLRFLRSQTPGRALTVGLFVSIVTFDISWRGIVPIPGFGYHLFATGFGLSAFLPFAADRLLASRLRDFSGTLVLPTAWVSVEFLTSWLSPFGSYGSIAYSQVTQPSVMQLASTTGIYGITFVIGWTAAVANWAWEQHFEWNAIRRGAFTYGMVVTVLSIWSGARVRFDGSDAPAVRVAGVTAPREKANMAMRVAQPRASKETLDSAEALTTELQDSLIAMTAREAEAGAKIITMSEYNGLVLAAEESSFVRRLEALAREHRVYFFPALGVITPGKDDIENTVLAIDTTGAIRWAIHKSHPCCPPDRVPAYDTLRYIDSPYGRLGAVVDFDASFPAHVRQTGEAKMDIVVIPSSDYPGIDPLAANMAIVRAIENGFALVRAANRGLSVATDARGRVLAATDYYTAFDKTLIAQVPVHGLHTVYARVGDMFAWLCLIGLGLLGLYAASVDPLITPRSDDEHWVPATKAGT